MKSVKVGIVIVVVCIALLQVLVPLHSACLRNIVKPVVEKKNSLGDGCYHVFIDVGSNIGMHVRFLFEPDRFPESKTYVAALQQQFGLLRDNRDFCVFSFEPNPKFQKRHQELKRVYEAMGWRYLPFHAGVSNKDGNFTFYHSHMKDKEQELGFSAVAPKDLYGNNAFAVNVPTVRLSNWILNEIRDREIPSTPYIVHPFGPKVVMKLDIEGLEFKVFPDLIISGALCHTVHFVFGEFHSSNNYRNFFPMNITSDGKNVLDLKSSKSFETTLMRILGISENCMTRLSFEDDDESYLTDPVEYPTPT